MIDSKYRSALFYGLQAGSHAEGHAEGMAEGRALGRAEGMAEGRAEAKSEAVLAVLRFRGIQVPEAAREEILIDGDLDQLDTWFHRALAAASIDDVFAE